MDKQNRKERANLTNKPMGELVRFDLAQVERNTKKDCQCQVPKYVADMKNRRISCKGCGAILDPFDTFVDMADRLTMRNNLMERWSNQAKLLQLEIENKQKHLDDLKKEIAELEATEKR